MSFYYSLPLIVKLILFQNLQIYSNFKVIVRLYYFIFLIIFCSCSNKSNLDACRCAKNVQRSEIDKDLEKACNNHTQNLTELEQVEWFDEVMQCLDEK